MTSTNRSRAMAASVGAPFVCAVVVLSAFVLIGGVARAESVVLGYQAWKTSRVEDARTALGSLQPQTEPGTAKASKPAEAGVRAKKERGDQRVQQAQLNLEIAQEMTVNDYFVLYLSQFKDREALVEAAKKLSPEEMAELMMGYQKQLSSGTQTDLSGLEPETTPSLASSPVEKPVKTGANASQ